MGKIIVYNLHEEDHSQEPNNFYIGRKEGGNPLSNPFTFNGVRKSLAKKSFKTREEAIEAFEKYFDLLYGKDEELTKAFDEIYSHYEKGENVYLACFCHPKPCHGDVIAKKLQEKLIKNKISLKEE